VFLKDGDTVTVSVEKIGEVTSRVRAEPATNG
jgi:2-keto-4-pentenoate hydratase/2-oxohepta-3-ene-1,7-dioic acid hydratase in catechol pathway